MSADPRRRPGPASAAAQTSRTPRSRSASPQRRSAPTSPGLNMPLNYRPQHPIRRRSSNHSANPFPKVMLKQFKLDPAKLQVGSLSIAAQHEAQAPSVRRRAAASRASNPIAAAMATTSGSRSNFPFDFTFGNPSNNTTSTGGRQQSGLYESPFQQISQGPSPQVTIAKSTATQLDEFEKVVAKGLLGGGTDRTRLERRDGERGGMPVGSGRTGGNSGGYEYRPYHDPRRR